MLQKELVLDKILVRKIMIQQRHHLDQDIIGRLTPRWITRQNIVKSLLRFVVILAA